MNPSASSGWPHRTDLNYMFHGTFIINDFHLMGFQVGQYIKFAHVASRNNSINQIRSSGSTPWAPLLHIFPFVLVPQLVIM